jgi:hypothetical protein
VEDVVAATIQPAVPGPSAQDSPDAVDHYRMTKEVWLEVLDALRAEAENGRLVCLVMALQPAENPDIVMVENFGTMEVTEIACRKTNEKLADMAEKFGRVDLASRIRQGLRVVK